MLNFEEFALVESGIRGMKDLAKQYKEAEIYFHVDLDGVTSAIGMKKYLQSYGIKVIDYHTMQYGDKEWLAAKPKSGNLAVMVDFAHGKTTMHIHTDHHDAQAGVSANTSTSFKHAKSNAGTISQEISPKEIFPPEDIKLISTVDSADFAANDITVDEVLRAAYEFDKKLGIEKNRTYMGLVVNKMLLAFKNKPGFLEEIAKESEPSLISMFTNIRKIAVKNKYPLEELVDKTEKYVASQAKDKKMQQLSSPKDVENLGSGEYGLIGTVLVQYGGGAMMKGGYDRYTPFKNNPEAEYLVIGWPLGLVQASKNPFKKGSNPYNLGEMAKKILSKYKGMLSKIDLTLGDLKSEFEKTMGKKGSEDSFGFVVDDFIALFGKDMKSSKWAKTPEHAEIISDISKRHYSKLSDKQKKILDNYKVNLYDIIISQSGGHKDITNISGLGLLKGQSVKFIKQIMVDFAEELKDAKLK